ncbi:DUF3958 family protein [Enterococcus sp. BWR-S5]|uniref:DUF3958 family protein n=1 Tax=Enterococcus sp. BWR-S5 TaxID=2787714 RepID=UPI001921F6F7|nr:DUF3958 family protein [Enterococcus sp. BWR-S5]MBL1224622.1 DUF3958 family protein [Enterococcus sp. BWR-S5]
MTENIADKEQELNGQLRLINEQQEENYTSFRKLDESERFIQDAYAMEQHFLTDLSEVFHTSDSAQFLHDSEQEHRECKHRSFTQLEEQFEALQQEKLTLVEKENDLLDERSVLFQREDAADEY